MKRHSGFTIVELVVVIAILGILLTLVTVNLSAGQVNSRDEERKVDVTNIASHLETFYNSGDGTFTPGGYPGTDQLASEALWLTALRDLNPANLRAPGYVGGTISLVPSTNNVQTTAGVLPQPTNTQYVYQPTLDGALCTLSANKCRQFILYYKLEATGVVVAVKSKNK